MNYVLLVLPFKIRCLLRGEFFSSSPFSNPALTCMLNFATRRPSQTAHSFPSPSTTISLRLACVSDILFQITYSKCLFYRAASSLSPVSMVEKGNRSHFMSWYSHSFQFVFHRFNLTAFSGMWFKNYCSMLTSHAELYCASLRTRMVCFMSLCFAIFMMWSGFLLSVPCKFNITVVLVRPHKVIQTERYSPTTRTARDTIPMVQNAARLAR